MELNDNKLPFLDILITSQVKKIWMNIYSKQPIQNAIFPTFLTNQNPALSIYCFVIVEKKNVGYMKLKEVRTILKTQKYPKMVSEK